MPTVQKHAIPEGFWEGVGVNSHLEQQKEARKRIFSDSPMQWGIVTSIVVAFVCLYWKVTSSPFGVIKIEDMNKTLNQTFSTNVIWAKYSSISVYDNKSPTMYGDIDFDYTAPDFVIKILILNLFSAIAFVIALIKDEVGILKLFGMVGKEKFKVKKGEDFDLKRSMTGAVYFSDIKGLAITLCWIIAGLIEMLSEPGTRFLQPVWDIVVFCGMPWISNQLWFGFLATFTYVVICMYFSYLDLTKSPTKVQKNWWPSVQDMLDVAVPQLIIYAFGQVMVWGLWIFYPEKYTVELPKLAPQIMPAFLQFCFCFIVGDFLIYWEHRIMHMVPYLRNNIHSVHHTYSTVFSWAGGWVHPFEDGIAVLCQATPVLLIHPHPLVQWYFTAFWVVCLIDEHSGHDVWWSPWQLLPFTGMPLGGGASPHDIHHYKPTKNYGFVLVVWDRLFGSFEPVAPACNPFVEPFILERKSTQAKRLAEERRASAAPTSSTDTSRDGAVGA